MEKEIGSETEMEEGTGGRRKGGREGNKGTEKRTGSTCVSVHPLVIYPSFQSSHKIHYGGGGGDNHSDPPLSCRPKSQSLPGN